MLHEDFIFPNKSREVIQYAKSQNIFDEIIESKPNQGIGNAIKKILNKVDTKFVLMLQDDWEFELPIDLDQLLWTMNKHDEINCVHFNRRKNMKVINGYQFQEYKFDFMYFLLHHHWPLGPGIWRTDFVKKRWKVAPAYKPQEGYWNQLLKDKNPVDKQIKEIGAYIYGPLEFPRVMRHLGDTWVMKPWGKNPRGKEPGGTAKREFKTSPIVAKNIEKYEFSSQGPYSPV